MIKGLKKFSISFLTLLFVFVLGFVCSSKLNVFASDDETVLSDYAIRVGELETRNLMGGVTLYKERVKSIYNGIDTGDNDPNSAKYRYTHGTVQWVDLPRLSEDVRVVSWSKGTQDGWTSSTVRTTALDFEAKNPGWIVVAAVNGDSFDINGTKEPTKLHVQDGSVYQPVVGYTQIGWQDDNSPIIGGATLSSNMFLEVLDEQKNIVKQVELASENGTLSETGINLITKDASSTYDLTGYTVYVGKYDTCRISKYNGKSFVKGTIENVVTDLTTNSKPLAERDGVVVREFYLASKDGSLDSFISTGDYVRCQYQLTGSWAGIKNVLCGFGGTASSDAFPAQVLKDSQPLGAGSTDSFAYTTHPRTMVGFKEDGSTVLMVCDGRGKQGDYEQGLSYFQEGEMMRLAGCVNAFNLDGGGSSTLVVRNSYGELEVINRPSDGSERYIGNAILFVMRDPGISWDVKNTTRTSATFVLKETEISNQVTDVKVTIDGKTVSMVDGVATVDGLKEDTEYAATVEYKVPSSKDPNKILNGFFKVDVKTKPFNMPSSGLVFEDANKTSIKLVKRETAYASWF
ncbi:MAG: phosphodiester glycosidase family protein, partial [Bacilli bacterium]